MGNHVQYYTYTVIQVKLVRDISLSTLFSFLFLLLKVVVNSGNLISMIHF